MLDVTVERKVTETCIAIWDQQLESITEWRKWLFPSCVGCFDGKNISTRNPDHSGSMFRNYISFWLYYKLLRDAITSLLQLTQEGTERQVTTCILIPVFIEGLKEIVG